MSKMVSMTNEPVMMPAAAGPRNETTGSMPPLSACFRQDADADAPLARAVRIKSWLKISNMPPRVKPRHVTGVVKPERDGGKNFVARRFPTGSVEHPENNAECENQ